MDETKYILERGFREVAKYFEEVVKNKRIDGKIPVLFTDFTDSIIYVPCDRQGYPKIRVYEFLTIMGQPKVVDELYEIPFVNTQVYKKVVEIDQPEIYYMVNTSSAYMPKPYFFMWRGKLVDKQEIPVEQLDVKYLMKLTQEAIEKREPIILDEAVKNRLIKQTKM